MGISEFSFGKPTKVNPRTIWLLSLVPFVWIYALGKIRKLALGSVILFGSAFILEMIIPFPYYIGLALLLHMILSPTLIRHWAKRWNEKLITHNINL